MGDALGLTAALRTRLPKSKALAGRPFTDAESGSDTHINAMTFGEQFVEALGEFVDAREQYAHTRRGIGGEYANSDDMNKAADRLQALIDRRLP